MNLSLPTKKKKKKIAFNSRWFLLIIKISRSNQFDLHFSIWITSGIYSFYFSVYGVEPDMTREGGSIPVTLTLQEATGKNVLLLPMGSCDDGAHSQNEKINRSNYIQGVRILAFWGGVR